MLKKEDEQDEEQRQRQRQWQWQSQVAVAVRALQADWAAGANAHARIPCPHIDTRRALKIVAGTTFFTADR